MIIIPIARTYSIALSTVLQYTDTHVLRFSVNYRLQAAAAAATSTRSNQKNARSRWPEWTMDRWSVD